MTDHDSIREVRDADELREVLGPVAPAARDKVRDRLHELDRQWLARSPFCLVATSSADGRCDVSPKGDPPGFVLVLDETTVVLPERPGNRRADGFRNVLENPHVGLIFFIPGRGDTLRINGRARLLREALYFDRMRVQGHRPQLALEVVVEEVFHHCSKAFLRSDLWDPGTWAPELVPSRATIAGALERRHESPEELARYYGPGYGKDLY
ncbi:pyridoxamine 5'-phosphate oxidase family protein [Engelhardtia mirabilis]|uniref:Pyridoxamine 5'-phosphate oxidase n=1 Tax=Engelhardtia mirabilis TaxID=2528011 RepID=A0A518BS21_9BACT|nr:Pyridoxamine 5'-phosphate oxidase [Planctomycetes bacterium Pla133]QDV04097.1 Pyridoxamine 5'-phosphate oxidase [Planctomycetes bacterium Pla86]